MPDKITNTYLHQLQAAYYDIGDRGIRVDYDKLKAARRKVFKLIQEQLKIACDQWNCKVFIGAANAPSKDDPAYKFCVNLNATQGDKALLKKLQDIGYHIPKITKKNEEGEYEQKYSTGELALQKMLVENQFNYPAGDPAIRAILKVRELGKLSTGYLNARLLCRIEEGISNYYFLSTYNVAGTLTGRRGSKRHTFGFGNNAQNFPKHSSSAGIYRECLIPREGNIFLFVDQVQAEDWPVSALSCNLNALKELRGGIDRHSALASAIFNQNIPPKSSPQWNESLHGLHRYLGKKVRHARNYGMRAKRMSESLAQEGFSVSEPVCKVLLDKAASIDPTVDTVFHKYVQDELSNTHMLHTPFGRERMFLGCRPNADNNSLFNEAYAYIPQSTVGDNTGFAVYYLEEALRTQSSIRPSCFIIQEGHDSIVQDIRAEKSSILQSLQRSIKAFKRSIRFDNGIEIEIPIEASIGYSFNEEVVIKTFDENGIATAMDKLEAKRAAAQVAA